MDIVTTASAFATIVQLLAIYKQEGNGAKSDSSQAFLAWLETHRHQDIKDLISRSYDLTVELDKILHQDHELIIARMQEIEHVLAVIASRSEPFHGLVQLLAPEAVLSGQALGFLKQVVCSQATEIAKYTHTGGASIQLVPDGGELEVSEPRFVEDDLNTLVAMGLLSLRMGAPGTTLYGITRNAARIVELAEMQPTSTKTKVGR